MPEEKQKAFRLTPSKSDSGGKWVAVRVRTESKHQGVHAHAGPSPFPQSGPPSLSEPQPPSAVPASLGNLAPPRPLRCDSLLASESSARHSLTWRWRLFLCRLQESSWWKRSVYSHKLAGRNPKFIRAWINVTFPTPGPPLLS